MLVKRLMEKYPKVDVSIFIGIFILNLTYDLSRINFNSSLNLIGGERVGVNPKINNIEPGYSAAKYELFMISDSGIRST